MFNRKPVKIQKYMCDIIRFTLLILFLFFFLHFISRTGNKGFLSVESLGIRRKDECIYWNEVFVYKDTSPATLSQYEPKASVKHIESFRKLV